MKKQTMTIAGIPAILYGSRSRNVYLYLHGKNGCKEELELKICLRMFTRIDQILALIC